MATYWIGADPGTPLSLAIVSPDGQMVAHSENTTTEGENDPVKVANTLLSWSGWYIKKGHNVKVIIEKVGIRPNENLVHAVPFVGSMYMATAVAATLGLEYHLAAPQRWKRAMKLTSDKKVSLGMARAEFPAKALFFKRVKDHNIAEAALLALYAQRNL